MGIVYIYKYAKKIAKTFTYLSIEVECPTVGVLQLEAESGDSLHKMGLYELLPTQGIHVSRIQPLNLTKLKKYTSQVYVADWHNCVHTPPPASFILPTKNYYKHKQTEARP